MPCSQKQLNNLCRNADLPNASSLVFAALSKLFLLVLCHGESEAVCLLQDLGGFSTDNDADITGCLVNNHFIDGDASNMVCLCMLNKEKTKINWSVKHEIVEKARG